MMIASALLSVLTLPLQSTGLDAAHMAVPPATPNTLTTVEKVWAVNVLSSSHSMVFLDHGSLIGMVPSGGGLDIWSAFDSLPAAPVWSAPIIDNFNFASSAEGTDRIMAGSVVIDFPSTSTGTLHMFDSTGPEPIWSFPFAPQFLSTPFHRMSRDGSVVVSMFDADATSIREIRVHNPDTGAVMRQYDHPIEIWANRFALASDGAALAHSRHSGLDTTTVIDVGTGAILFEAPGTLPVRGGLSAGGQDVVTRELEEGVGWHLRVFSRASGSWQTMLEVTTPESAPPSDMALSADGRVVAAGWPVPGEPLQAMFRAYDVAAGALLMEHVTQPTFGNQDKITGLSVSDDGNRVAVGKWGAGGQGPAELIVYDPWADSVVASMAPGGSVLGVRLSADGRRVLAHRTNVHAQFGYSASWVELWELPGEDLRVRGTPSLDEQITIDVFGTVGHPALLLAAAGLAATPIPASTGGALLLDPLTLIAVPIGSIAGDGSATRDLDIPPLPSLVGLALYLQGATLSPLALGHTWEKVSILP